MLPVKTQIISIILFAIALTLDYVTCLKHQLVLTNDRRPFVLISSFGYLNGGTLQVIVENLTLSPDPADEFTYPEYGFMFLKTDRVEEVDLLYDSSYSCILNEKIEYDKNERYGQMSLTFNASDEKVLLNCNSASGLGAMPTPIPLPYNRREHKLDKRELGLESSNQFALPHREDEVNYVHAIPKRPTLNLNPCKGNSYLPLVVHTNQFEHKSYSFNFSMSFNHDQEGIYYFTFQNCRGRFNPLERNTPVMFNLSLDIEETNYGKNYLTAGRIPLPEMYFMLSVMFLLVSFVWLGFISRQKDSALKIHHLMTVLVFFKSCSLFIHGINYHYIAIYGHPVVTWAYIYYTTRSLKGALFFITLALIGSGWSFIKHILSDRDKKIIMIVVGLQVIAHIAEIIFDESAEGEPSYEFWGQLASLVDLISCLAILYPIGFSVKHLEEASRTDGKAAINLKKMELFKKFYIISTVYIYITRIVSFVFISMLSFRRVWYAELITEVSTLIYFIITGYYFQPMPTNPYLLLSSDNDLDEDILFSVDSADVTDDKHPLERLDGVQDSKVTRRLIEEVV